MIINLLNRQSFRRLFDEPPELLTSQDWFYREDYGVGVGVLVGITGVLVWVGVSVGMDVFVRVAVMVGEAVVVGVSVGMGVTVDVLVTDGSSQLSGMV